ncbi:protein ALTERED XYLOGLUCAN 4-like [Punica granatum]|uniref:Uncharacterized protein n=2 Tax=Punica granatum TaxID=22663 RepID=A0A218XYN5_PUNGR|nr:protein ALTERED XYLOGLUCAN 4-like [Punica granatum]OWM89621.1 hypothetical protein CDL15_Pgr024369 [Punica granatum]PKI47245.1 hypothetical protein CRG98_032382 [Punica granatum]
MGLTSPFKEQPPQSLTRKLLPWTIYALASIILFWLYFYSLPFTNSPVHELSRPAPALVSSSFSSSSPAPPLPEGQEDEEERKSEPQPGCDYTNGKWVQDITVGPLYNGSSCGTIKDGQNCMAHGRPDLEFLQWRWSPNQCPLPRFDPNTFLDILSNRHIAFVGDSLARNQLESLLCMLSSVSAPNLVYTNGEDNKFRKWHFPRENVSVSVYWSPFLVKGLEKSSTGPDYNRLFLDSVDERWASDLGSLDMLVLSFGHWYLLPAVYFKRDSILGCHYCPGANYTEIGFYDVLRKALRTTLKAVSERSRANGGKGKHVFVTTFVPSHFEGDWDKFGACPKTRPFEEGEKPLEGMDAEMRKIELEEVQSAKEDARDIDGFRLEALDVTRLSLLRPDGHPGPYMYPFPFANGIKDRVHNDCVHWCLPGPIDTWNEILLEVIKGWTHQSRRR